MPEDYRAQNLRKAQWARSQRRQLKEALKGRRIDAVALVNGAIAEWEPVLAQMPYEKVLMLVPGIGETTTGDLIVEFGVAGKIELGALSYAQRARLGELLYVALNGERPITTEAAHVD